MTSLDYELTSTVEPGYLRIHARGIYKLQPTMRLIDAVAMETSRHLADKVLVDVREVAGQPSGMDRFELGVAIAARIRAKLAVVAREETIDHFAETVAVNRGANGRIFPAEDEALAWLLGD